MLSHNGSYFGGSALFTFASLIVFYSIVYGIPLGGDLIVTIRSVILIVFSISIILIVSKSDPIGVEFTGIKFVDYKTIMWGTACFIINFALIGILYVLFKDFILSANSKFYFQDIRPRGLPLKMLMSASAALSEETVYRLVLFRYILSLESIPSALRQALALIISSLLFGFGHFHAGVERCLISSVSGLVFAAFFIWRKNLWVAVLGHFIGDSLAFAMIR